MFSNTKKIKIECPDCKSQMKISEKDLKYYNIILCEKCSCKFDIGNLKVPQNLKNIEQSFLNLVK